MKLRCNSNWLMVATLLLAGCATRAQEAPKPLLDNPGFESDLEGWTPREKIIMSSVKAEAARTGAKGLHIEDTDEVRGSGLFSAAVPVEVGREYRLGFWARTSIKNFAAVYFTFNGADGKQLASTTPSAPIDDADGAWHEHRLAVRAPQDAVTMALWVHTYGKPKGTVDLDDFTLEIGTPLPAGETAPVAAKVEKGVPVPRQAPPYIMIKVDDLKNLRGKVHPRWQKFAEFIRARKIHAGIGIICDSLEGDNPDYEKWIKEQQDTGLFEFWCHGYDHKQWKEGDKTLEEFKGPSYEIQKQHLTRCNELAKQKLGKAFVTFGAPFNSTDENTAKALAEDPDFKISLYGDAKNPGGKVVLDRVYPVNIENPLFVPSLEKFEEGYAKYPNRDYFVIQGHAAQWDEPRFEQFTKIVDFLIGQKAIFVTPEEYVKLKNLTPKTP